MIDIHTTKDWRYERKYLISSMSRSEVEMCMRMHPAMFREIYHKRQVNNLYFDTLNLDNFNDNVVGRNNRKKVRIRWYGDLFCVADEPALEVKIKKGAVGGKLRYKIPPFIISEGDKTISATKLLDMLPDNLGSIREELSLLRCTLMNCYTRNYYLSADRKFRATIDHSMTYYNVNTFSNTFSRKITDSESVIVELKYSSESDCGAENVSNSFPFRVTKSSKYVQGLMHFL